MLLEHTGAPAAARVESVRPGSVGDARLGGSVKLGLMTTWNTQGGVAEYSRALVEALRERADVEVTVLGSRNYDERAVAENESYVLPCFDVAAWNREGRDALDVEAILALGLEVLHVQYCSGIYNEARLAELLRRFEGPKFATWHDNVLPEHFDWRLFDQALTHREGVGAGDPVVVPHLIRKLPPLVRTFGMGRTREDVIRPICERNGWVFESLASSEEAPGETPWKPWRELHDWLRGADVIVLWYGDDPLAGSSGAARTAIAARRPVIVNDAHAFRELPQQSGSFYKLKDDPAVLESTLREILRPDTMIERWSAEAIADQHVAGYVAALTSRALEPEPQPSRGLWGLLQRLGGRLRAIRARVPRVSSLLAPLRRRRRHRAPRERP
jgi:hypothetical protein